MGLEAVELDEAPRVEELVDAVARTALALGVALGDALLAPAEQRLAVPALELCEILFDSHELP